MAFGRKPAVVGTALDREELEQLLERVEKATGLMKDAIFELSQETRKAARVADDLSTAIKKSEAEGRRRLAGRKW